MKKWMVYYKTESCDEYFGFFDSKKEPTILQCIEYFVDCFDPDCKGHFDEKFHPVDTIKEIKGFEKL